MRQEESQKVILPVEGMHCAACVAKVEGALSKTKGVKTASVHLPSKTASVEYDPASVDPESLRLVVEGQGYRVPGIAANYEQAEALLLSGARKESHKLARRLLVTASLWLALMVQRPLEFSDYTAWLVSLPVIIYGAGPFHRGFTASVRRGQADMNTLVSLSTWAAFLFSSWVVFFPEYAPPASRKPMLEALAGLVTLILLGRWLDLRMRSRTNDAIRRLMRLAPRTLRLIKEGVESTVPVGEAKVGNRFLVRPGEQVGLDGVVEDGASTVDESLLTGESIPVEKMKGSSVFGGTMNKTGALIVNVVRTGSDTALARIVEAVRQSGNSKAPIQHAVDRAAAAFVPGVILVAVVAGVMWSWKGPEPKVVHGLTVLVSVMAVACPCALGLATPLAIVVGMGRAAQLGIFLRRAEVLEKVGKIDAVLFDKTGTLTEGKPSVVELLPSRGVLEKDLLAWAAMAESRSEHPFAAAIRARADADGASAAAPESFEAFPGRGVRAVSQGKLVRVGNAKWLEEEGVEVADSIVKRLRDTSGSALVVALDRRLLGAVIVADKLRDGAREAVAKLKAQGVELILVSGDRNQAVYRIAEEAGISKVYAEVLPHEKAEIIKDLQARGRKVAMVGEGFNDAPALTQADVGVALAEGTDIAIESADITLMRADIRSFVTAIELSRRIRRVIVENLLWAFAYNLVLIPIAAGALYPSFGLMLDPRWAGAAMALSSVTVVVNSLKLRRFQP